MMEKSQSIASLASALAKAQAEMGNTAKKATNPHFKKNYADLNQVLEVAKETLPKFGLSIAQFPTECAGGIVGVTTILMHESGEWVQGTATAPIEKSNAQGVGSAITYLRRYALKSVLGIADEDDDGNKASEKGKETPPPKTEKPTPLPAKPNPFAYAVTEAGGVSKLFAQMLDDLRKMDTTTAELWQGKWDATATNDAKKEVCKELFNKL